MRSAFSILLVAALCAISLMAYAAEDKECLDNCLQNEYVPKYCQEMCSDDSSPMNRQQTIRQIEPHCMANCRNNGHEDDYCAKACSY